MTRCSWCSFVCQISNFCFVIGERQVRRRPAAGRRCGAAAASRRPARRKISHAAIFCVNNPAAGRRETASNVERRPAQCARRRLIALLFLISAFYLYRTAHSDGSGEVSVGGVMDRTDRYEYFVVLNEIFAYASIEIFRWARRFAHVNGSGYRIFFAEVCWTDFSVVANWLM